MSGDEWFGVVEGWWRGYREDMERIWRGYGVPRYVGGAD